MGRRRAKTLAGYMDLGGSPRRTATPPASIPENQALLSVIMRRQGRAGWRACPAVNHRAKCGVGNGMSCQEVRGRLPKYVAGERLVLRRNTPDVSYGVGRI